MQESMKQEMVTEEAPAYVPVASESRTKLQSVSAPAGRLVSLDVFRGATIAGMILVDNPGAVTTYPPLAHAVWHGWTFADTIAPAFLWIVGVAMTFSFTKRLKAGASKAELFRHVLRRTLILIVIGLYFEGLPQLVALTQGSAHLDHWRFVGTLQRIALCYCAASALLLWTKPRTQAIWAVLLLVLSGVLLMLVPVPGYGAGVLTPMGNTQRWINHILLGTHAKDADPLGLLGTIPAISTTLFGVLTGHLLHRDMGAGRRTWYMLLGGIAFTIVGRLLDAVIPINTHLWTPSYAVFMAGLSLIAFAVCYWFCDVRRWRGWTLPFVVLGMNAIFIFVLDGTIRYLLLSKGTSRPDGSWVSLKGAAYARFFEPMGSAEMTSFLFALAWTILITLIAYGMYRKRWFVKI